MASERICTPVDLAEDAFSNQTDQPHVERQLIKFHTDALREDHLKLRMLRENPSTTVSVVEIAMTTEDVQRRFELRTGGTGGTERRAPATAVSASQRRQEAMEIDHVLSDE